jgi:hypothetical protein
MLFFIYIGGGVMKSFIFVWLFSSLCFAEEWTPDYQHTIECKQDGPVEICAINKGLTYQRLLIRYDGYLLADTNRSFNAYVSLNGVDGFYPLDVSYEKAETELNKTKAYLCLAQNTYQKCKYTIKDGNKIVYEVEKNPQNILFNNTFKEGIPQTWHVQVAINAGGEWDSDYGNNFKAVFN